MWLGRQDQGHLGLPRVLISNAWGGSWAEQTGYPQPMAIGMYSHRHYWVQLAHEASFLGVVVLDA